MSPLLLLGLVLPFISAAVTLEDHEGKSRKLEVPSKGPVSERGQIRSRGLRNGRKQ